MLANLYFNAQIADSFCTVRILQRPILFYIRGGKCSISGKGQQQPLSASALAKFSHTENLPADLLQPLCPAAEHPNGEISVHELRDASLGVFEMGQVVPGFPEKKYPDGKDG